MLETHHDFNQMYSNVAKVTTFQFTYILKWENKNWSAMCLFPFNQNYVRLLSLTNMLLLPKLNHTQEDVNLSVRRQHPVFVHPPSTPLFSLWLYYRGLSMENLPKPYMHILIFKREKTQDFSLECNNVLETISTASGWWLTHTRFSHFLVYIYTKKSSI